MKHRPRIGRHPLTLGAIALLGLSGYELWVRLDDFRSWTSGIRHLSRVRGTSFVEDLTIVFQAPEMRALGFKMLFLALCILFSLVCLIRRNRSRGAVALIALDLALAAAGAALGLYSLHPSGWLETMKLAPLALIAVGCVLNLLSTRSRRRRRHPSSSERNHHTHERRDTD